MIAELAAVCGVELDVRRSEDVYALLVDAVAVYAGITLEEIAGHGTRWPERPGAIALSLPAEDTPSFAASETTRPALTNGHLALGTYRPLFASPEVDISPGAAVPRHRPAR